MQKDPQTILNAPMPAGAMTSSPGAEVSHSDDEPQAAGDHNPDDQANEIPHVPEPAGAAVPEPLAAPAPVSVKSIKAAHPHATRKGPGVLPMMVPTLMAAGLAIFWWLRSRRAPEAAKPTATAKQSGRKPGRQAGAATPAPPAEELIAPDTFQLLVAPLQLLPPSPPPAPLAPPPLAGMSFVVSEDIDVAGVPTTFGVPEWAPYNQDALGTAPAVARAVAAGAMCTGKAGIQPAGLDLVGADYGNPSNKTRVSGGSNTGAAAMVAQGLATFALAPDSLGQVRVPAACCSLYAYRPSPGALGGPSALITPTGSGTDAMCVLARDVGTVMRVAEVLGAPGSSNIRGEILKFVVAQDLFDLCAPELQPAILALKKAILKWAGSDQAGAVQLVRFLSSNVGGWEALVPLPPGQRDVAMPRLDDFLEATVVASEALQRAGLHQRAGHLSAAHAAATAVPEAADQGSPDEAQEDELAQAAAELGQAESTQELAHDQEPPIEPPAPAQKAEGLPDANPGQAQGAAETAAQGEAQALGGSRADSAAVAALSMLNRSTSYIPGVLPPEPTPEQLADAQKMAKDMLECLRATVKPDTIMVLPALPFPPPKRGAGGSEKRVWSRLAHVFNALGSLGGCPMLTLPVGHLRDGSPVAITLMAVHRFDMRLLAVAQKLSPMIAESFQAVKEEITQMAMQQRADDEAAKSKSNRPPASGKQAKPESQGGVAPSISNGHLQRPSGATELDPKKAEKAEKSKAKGNALYQAGKFAEALNEYTKAISFNPSSHVYYSNRAIACIKLFRFEQAEEDCNRALDFDLSDKDKVKALLRRATARDALQKYEGAEKDLRSVLSTEPNNKQAREDLQALRQHKSQMAQAQTAMATQLRAQQIGMQGMPGFGEGGMPQEMLMGQGQGARGFN